MSHRWRIFCIKKRKILYREKCGIFNKKKSSRASLENDLFRLWKENHPEYKDFISEVKVAFDYRHGLAHGRYWEPKLGKKYDYNSLYDLASLIKQLTLSSLT